jgi:hypothetical protein
MNASHTSPASPAYSHPAGTPPAHLRTVLLILYPALAAQLAIWSSLAAHVGIAAAFTEPHPGTEAAIVVGGAIWLVLFTIAVVAATIRYRRYSR